MGKMLGNPESFSISNDSPWWPSECNDFVMLRIVMWTHEYLYELHLGYVLSPNCTQMQMWSAYIKHTELP